MADIVDLSENSNDNLSRTSRILLGITGGFCAILLKIYAHDIEVIGSWVLRVYRGLMSDPELELAVGYAIVAMCIMFLGGLIGYLVDENSRLKMLALGVSAPAMLTTFAGGIDVSAPVSGPADNPAISEPTPGPAGFLDGIAPVTSAHAAEAGSLSLSSSRISKGARLFFGAAPEQKEPVPTMPALSEERFWVIIGSSTDVDEALAMAEAINAQEPEYEAFVGARKDDNPHYPVIIGGLEGFLPEIEARALREKAVRSGIAPLDAYLSDYADRLPPVAVP